MTSNIRGGPVKMNKMSFELILLGFFGLSYAAIQRPDYDDTPEPEFFNPSWMTSIPDDQPLSEVTMPGTHNTMALYGGVYAECQSWSLASQLRAGVRFLDIRVRNVKGNLTIHHGVSYQRAHFGHVLEGVADFLQEFPSETVLMRIKEEVSETYDIYGAVVDYMQRYAVWDLLWHSRLVPTMGEARGKLIILQDFSGPDLGMRYGSLDIADDWKVPTLLHVDEKWQSIYEHLEGAPAGNKAQIFLTYSSGAGVFAYPRAVAQRINAQLYDYLRAKTDLNQRLGIICMDFPAAPIIQMITDFQLKEVVKRRQTFNPMSSKLGRYSITLLLQLIFMLMSLTFALFTIDMESSPPGAFKAFSAVQISTIVVVNIIWCMFMIAAIGIGATHLSRCPVQSYIPIYLIVMGASSLLSLSLTYTKNTWKDGAVYILSTFCMSLLHLFSFCWLIAGTSWVYSVYPPNYSPEEDRYCHRTTYLFAFFVTTLTWVIVVLTFFCVGCFALLTCCKTVSARHRLIPNRHTFYGGTSDSQEPPAGDV